MPPQNGVIGGRAAADEGSEEALLTSLNLWARSPKSLLSSQHQPAMAGDEGNEEALLTNLNSWANSPNSLPRKFKCEIFLDFNIIFKYLCLLGVEVESWVQAFSTLRGDFVMRTQNKIHFKYRIKS